MSKRRNILKVESLSIRQEKTEVKAETAIG